MIADEPGRMPIVTTEGVLGGKPRLKGRRVSVLQVVELVNSLDRDSPTPDWIEH